MIRSDKIKRFVQDTLGCGCPEEAFRSIAVRQDVRLSSFIVLDAEIIIGNRLLIYITKTGSAGCIEEHLPVLVAAGRKEREERKLNRFRLVLAADDPDEVQQAADKLFEGLRGLDEKVHLHVIRKKDLSFTAEDAEESK